MGFLLLSHMGSFSFIKSVPVLVKGEFPYLIYLK